MLVKKIKKEEKSGKTELLKDDINNILDLFRMNFTNKGEDIL